MNIIVTGIPRSGTSIMMQMLSAGGFPVAFDEIRPADPGNPKGYYELDAVRDGLEWLDQTEGAAVKLVSFSLKQLPSGREYKIIFVLRDLDEVLASQQKFVALHGTLEPLPLSVGESCKIMLDHINDLREWLDSRGEKVCYVYYNQAMEVPRSVALEVAEFLGADLDIDAMASAVDPSLYRNRRAV